MILFHSLSKEQLAKIVDVQIEHLRKRLADRNIKLVLQRCGEKAAGGRGI